MAQEMVVRYSALSNCESYFERIQSTKKLPKPLQETLNHAFSRIPVSSFSGVPGGKVIEIPADTTIADAVKILSECKILSAPVTNPNAREDMSWRDRYLGIVDYSAIILWVLESAELAAAVLSAGSATAVGVGAGAVGAIGAMALGATGPVAVAGIAAAAVGAAVAGGVAVDKGIGKDAPTAADCLGDDFYKVLLQEEPFKSTTVELILKSYRWVPFLPVTQNNSMLCILLLLSKYRLRNVPVIESGKPGLKNYITQSAIVQGLERCRGRDWFDCIAARPISDLGLPFMSCHDASICSGLLIWVISIQSEELILEAFKKMRDNHIGGLPLTVMDFIKIVVTLPEDVGRLAPPFTCRLESTLGSVINSLASKSVHRIYVVAGDEEVVGVITLRDVISCFIFEPPNYLINHFGFSAEEML
ncbi:SNF1-related protein kinase regulatory subunit gamma-1-like protein, partial [Cucurbita argyrosperma subsp. argyrosperma]